MAEKIPMTALSPTMEEGTISSWSAKEGDVISAGDVLCEVETDKASMDYEATQEGTLLKIIVGEGSNATVGQTIAIIGEKGEDISSLTEEAAAEGGAAQSQSAGTDVSSSKAPAEQTQKGEAGSTEDGGEKSADAKNAGAATDRGESRAQSQQKTASTETAGAPTAEHPSRDDGSRIKASPLAVKLAADRNINLNLVTGSGPGGRIVKQDIESFRGVSMSTVTGSTQTAAMGAAPAMTDQEIPVAGKRAVIAKRLSESKFTAPHYYLKTSVEMGGVVGARKLLNEAATGKVSLNAFFIKFSAEAIKRHPHINASWQGDKIVQFGSIDVGLAVDLGSGLITPVVRNCGNKGVVEIDSELQELIGKVRDGKLKPDEYTGATFTISNLGSFGVEEFTAIINPPGSAILALGATKKTPVVKDDGSIGVASIMKMTLSCDHRVIDGAAGGKFLSELQKMMEQPVRMLF